MLKLFEPINVEAGYPIIEASNDKTLPLSDLPSDNQKLDIFYDYLNTGAKTDAEIRNYFTNSRNENCSCIYLNQSFYNTDTTIRLQSTTVCSSSLPKRSKI